MNLLQVDSNGDVLLESIAVMAQAQGESGGGGGNSATCYSSYTKPSFLGRSTYIYRCGTCADVEAGSFSDPGTCNF